MAAESVVELMGRVDEHATHETPSALVNALGVYEGIRDGDSSGSALIDMVITRSGLYLPDVTNPYHEVEEEIAQNVGEVALVVVSRHVQDRLRTDDGWQARIPHGGSFLAGRITDSKVIVDKENGTWSIPTERYFAGYMGAMNLAGTGPMPVDDRLSNPSVPVGNATLGRELSTSTMTRNSGDHIPYEIPYRVFQETAVYIGQAAIDKAGHGVFELVPSEKPLLPA